MQMDLNQAYEFFLLIFLSGLTKFFQTTSTKMAKVRVNSEKVKYTPEHIEARYDYETTHVEVDTDGSYVATPQTTRFTFQTQRQVCC